MATSETLMAIVGVPVDSATVRGLIAADRLIASSEPDLDEGEPARAYWSSQVAGYQIMHCAGRVDTVFVYAQAADDFQAFAGPLPGGLAAQATRRDVLRIFGKPERTGKAISIPGLGRQGAWDRFRNGAVCVHFQYTEPDERIRLVSLMAADKAP